MELEKFNFKLKVTRVNRKSMDKLIKLADSENADNCQKLDSSMDGKEKDFDVDAIVYAPELAFSLYALAIVHCYSIVENTRKLICKKIPGITNNQLKCLDKIEKVTKCLENINIDHENIRCYKTMDEFRLVNNAIKHDRYNLSTHVTTKNKVVYNSIELKSLYSKTTDLETYLDDLYKRIVTKTEII